MLYWVRAAIICFEHREPKVLGNRLVMDLRDEGGSRCETLPKLLFSLDELFLDFVNSKVHQAKLCPERVHRVGGECIWLRLLWVVALAMSTGPERSSVLLGVPQGVSGEHRKSSSSGCLGIGGHPGAGGSPCCAIGGACWSWRESFMELSMYILGQTLIGRVKEQELTLREGVLQLESTSWCFRIE
ncbi:hypothetical protein B296_00033707 [Ensete ventricosum]|uniref:Uncharacterized protein n=1 Tax=Ensete ventricosum TaxID=4639 RepID=A0A426YHI3_ENSVE|nr:hypothetical protein B296_00033707 [Ensete ventricosum]